MRIKYVHYFSFKLIVAKPLPLRILVEAGNKKKLFAKSISMLYTKQDYLHKYYEEKSAGMHLFFLHTQSIQKKRTDSKRQFFY